MANNLAAKLRLPGNFKDMQWQVLILSMMVLPLSTFILDLLL